MSAFDAINALFEFGGALVLLLNIRALWRDRKLAGVRIAPTVWYQCWGAWNLVYYFQIGQRLSWFAGFAVFAVNSVWVLLAIAFTRKNSRVARICAVIAGDTLHSEESDEELRERIYRRFAGPLGSKAAVRSAIADALRETLPANIAVTMSFGTDAGIETGRIHITVSEGAR